MRMIARVALAPLVAAPIAAEELSAREVMQRVDDRDDGDRSVRKLEMILIDKNGGERVRRLQSWSRDEGEDVQSIMFFLSPADVKNTGGRGGGSTTAAHFISDFVGETPWVHIDVAATSMLDSTRFG